MLDEATSSLDEVTEREVLERLQRVTDKTVLIITHRKAALEASNRMIEYVENEEGITEWISDEM